VKTVAMTFSILTAISKLGISPFAVMLQYLQDEGVGFYLAMPSRHLPGLAKVVEGLMRHQEHQNFVFVLELQGSVQPLPRMLPSRVAT
jgi:hypothetical protein